jgi:flagellar protein FlaG
MPNAKQAAVKVVAQAAQASQATRQAIALQAQQAAAAKTEPLIDVEELRKKVDEAISRLNDQLQESQTKLGFQVDQATDSLVIKVMNKQTGELVRQIPTEVAVKLLQNPQEIKGLLLDEEL